MDLTKFPQVPTDLVEALETLYPDRHPDSVFDHHTSLVTAGTIKLIRYLRWVHDEQSKSVLGDTDVYDT